MADEDIDDFGERWNARVTAIEKVLGPTDGIVGVNAVPFFLGYDAGGAADIIYFRKHIPGVIAVTSELIDGYEDQVENGLGNYELMICHRDDVEWGAGIINRLAYYTLDAKLEPGETMDICPAVPDGSTITSLLFCDYARFEVRGRKAGLLLCLGITAVELAECRRGRSSEVVEALKKQGVYPFTDLTRDSVRIKGKRWFGW